MIEVTYYFKVVAVYDDELDYHRTNVCLCTDFKKGEVSISPIGSKNLKYAVETRKPKIVDLGVPLNIDDFETEIDFKQLCLEDFFDDIDQ